MWRKTMYLDHVAIYTNDLDKMRDFYVKYFGGVSNEKYRNERTGLESYFITFKSGSRLEIMYRPEISDRIQCERVTGLTHLSFHLGTRARVDHLTEVLVGDGFLLKDAPRITGDGYYESCVLDPENNEIEIMA